MLPPDAAEIKRRAEAVNLSLKHIARAANVDPSTLYAALRGDRENLPRTLRPVADALVAEELRLLRHLATIHPSTEETAA